MSNYNFNPSEGKMIPAPNCLPLTPDSCSPDFTPVDATDLGGLSVETGATFSLSPAQVWSNAYFFLPYQIRTQIRPIFLLFPR